MFSVIKKYSVFLLFAAALTACKEREIYPDIPSITYKSAYITMEPDPIDPANPDALLGVVFSYKDGDGDIGLGEADTLAPYDRKANEFGEPTNKYFSNIHVDYLEMHEGRLKPVIIPNRVDTFKVELRVGSLTPDGRFKAIRGDIDFQFSPPKYPDRGDSIVLKITLYDRALHKSNTIESPLLILP